MPQDAFADAPLRYHRQESGYLLYSVGRNGKDDGGRGEGVRAGNAELGDDLVVRTPGKERLIKLPEPAP